MFETTLIESRTPTQNRRFGFSKTFVISFIAHALVGVAIMAIPMWIIQALPDKQAIAFLLPPLPLTQPLPPPVASGGPAKNTAPPKFKITRSEFMAPDKVPTVLPRPSDELSEIADLAPSTLGSAGGTGVIPGGVPGGVPSDVLGKVNTPRLPPPPKKRVPIRVGGAVQQAKLVRRVDPIYPALAQRARVSGTVILQVTVSENGFVDDVELMRGHPLLNEAAVDAVRQWVYQPTVLNGEPVPVIATITVNFNLR